MYAYNAEVIMPNGKPNQITGVMHDPQNRHMMMHMQRGTALSGHTACSNSDEHIQKQKKATAAQPNCGRPLPTKLHTIHAKHAQLRYELERVE